LGFGSEFRTENFEILKVTKLHILERGGDSFQGNTRNSRQIQWYNLGVYLDVALDITEDFLVNGTVRYEDYSDFGSATVWKASTRYKFSDDKVTLEHPFQLVLEPSLHQIYTQNHNLLLFQDKVLLFKVWLTMFHQLLSGVPKLDSENSTNFTAGMV
jgi:iron complex outermembrane receptor protein